jgi:glycosyltransferase involved in cell wall biosynthesis
VRVLLADPPAFTPPYDRALAAALARAGAEVELLTSHFRFGVVPPADGYEVSEGFYPVSSRVASRPVRLALKALEHPLGLARLGLAAPDVVHLQWCGFPEIDRWLLRTRAPLVFTAHDLLPRRTARKVGLWRSLFARFDRVVVHSDNGRVALEAFGADPERLRVVPHPVFHSEPERRDDGRTVLALGVLRPYKGLDEAVTATLATRAGRLLVAGDPRIPVEALRTAAGDRAEWRLGYLAQDDLERALAEATVAVFPYRAELDQSGALLQALGAGVPAVVYDVGGLGEVVARYGAGAVVAAGDVQGLTDALEWLLSDGPALAAARAGAQRARSDLTWDAAADAHLAVYRELL